MATHSSVIAWRIPGRGEPAGLPSMGSHRVGHNWSDLAAAAAVHTEAMYTLESLKCPIALCQKVYIPNFKKTSLLKYASHYLSLQWVIIFFFPVEGLISVLMAAKLLGWWLL